MEDKIFIVGQLVSKTCAKCGSEQSHAITTLTKKGLISKVTCTVCSTVSAFKSGIAAAKAEDKQKASTPYDRTRTYRKGQTMMHSSFGYGEVLSLIEPQKIDVKFSDGMRRLIHARDQL